jgi:L-alanine-DL-glutamate epimerase-like enolase superfamily enzyme
MISGGFTECKKIIDLAKKEEIRTVVTSSLETEIGRTACLHLAAANEIKEACGLATGELLSEDKHQNPIIDGILSLSKTPGMGIKL